MPYSFPSKTKAVSLFNLVGCHLREALWLSSTHYRIILHQYVEDTLFL